jgi:hypothetical protein
MKIKRILTYAKAGCKKMFKAPQQRIKRKLMRKMSTLSLDDNNTNAI